MSSSNYFILLLAGLFFVGTFGDQQQDSSIMMDSISLPKDSLGLKNDPLVSVEQQQNEDEIPAAAAKEDDGMPEAPIEDGQHKDEAVQQKGKGEEEGPKTEENGGKMMEEGEGKNVDEKEMEEGVEEKKKEGGQEEVAKPEGDGTKTEEAQKGIENNKEQKGALNWLSKLYCMIFGLGGWGCPTTDKKATEAGVAKEGGGMPHKGKRRMIAVGWEEDEDGEAGFGAGMASLEQEVEEGEKKGEEPKKEEGAEEKEKDAKKVNEMEEVEDDKTGTEEEGTLTLN